MEPLSFAIRGENGDHVELTLIEVFGFPDHTSHFGGYEARCRLSVKSAGYSALGELWTSSGEVHGLAVLLRKGFEELSGTIEWKSCEDDLRLKIHFGERGTVEVCGEYREYAHSYNRLSFNFEMDQTFLGPTLMQMEEIAAKYGDQFGVAKSK